MNDEINEILDNWKYVIDNKITVYGETITFKQIKILLDYITNLRQSNERAFELLQQLHCLFGNNDSIHEKIEDIQKVLKGNDDK